MPGDHENVVKLNADHSGVCKFGPSQRDQDNFKLVRGNIRDLYRNALKNRELSSLPPIIGQKEESTDEDGLYARWTKFRGKLYEDIVKYKYPLRY